MAKMKMAINQVQKTILQQMDSLDPVWRIEYMLQTIALVDENTIRLCCRKTNHHVNFDICYRPGPDAYDVQAHLLWNHDSDFAKIVDVKEVMWDQLAELLREAHDEVQICNQCGTSVKPGTGRFVNRVPSLDDAEDRARSGYPHPEGDFTCWECDSQ